MAKEELGKVVEQEHCQHETLQMLELEHLGVDHPQVGAWLAQHWQLPEEFQMAILYSHTPEFFETPQELHYLIDSVALSGVIADIWTNPETDRAIAFAKEKGQGRLCLQSEDWEAIFNGIINDLPHIAGFFQTKLGAIEDLVKVQQYAIKELATALPAPTS